MQKPLAIYRCYGSDDLSATIYVASGEINAVAMKKEGSSFEVRARSANSNRSGEVYTILRFPGLKGCL